MATERGETLNIAAALSRALPDSLCGIFATMSDLNPCRFFASTAKYSTHLAATAAFSARGLSPQPGTPGTPGTPQVTALQNVPPSHTFPEQHPEHVTPTPKPIPTTRNTRNTRNNTGQRVAGSGNNREQGVTEPVTLHRV